MQIYQQENKFCEIETFRKVLVTFDISFSFSHHMPAGGEDKSTLKDWEDLGSLLGLGNLFG